MEEKNKKKPKADGKLQMMKMTFYHYFYFFVLVSVVVIISAGLFILIIPKYKAVSGELEERDRAKQMELDYLNKYQIELQKYKNSYYKLSQEDRERINIMLPKIENIEELFTEMSVLVKKNGLLLNSIELNNTEKKTSGNAIAKKSDSSGGEEYAMPETPADIGVIEIKLSISGVDYKSLKNILNAFEKNLRILDVNNISFSSGKDLSLSVATYYVQPSE